MPKTPADNADWLAEAATIKPLGSKAPPTKSAKPGGKPVPHNPHVKRSLANYPHHDPFPVLSNTAQLIHGHAPHLEKHIPKDLAQGKILPTAVVDLHGLGEGDAWLELVDFLHAAADQDHRCALVIHGKGQGYGPLRDMGVIKVQIGGWLANHPRVLAFHTAHPVHGGTGAIYVYLRRRRM